LHASSSPNPNPKTLGSLTTIFLPLTWTVWWLHAIMMIFGGMAILLIETSSAQFLERHDPEAEIREEENPKDSK
jgi:hypothetical protein